MQAVVVGAGFGGLGAAIRLAAAGHDVTVLEKRDRAGGRAYVHDIEGYRFDAGPTVLTAPFMFEELFELAGERLEDHVRLVPVEPLYRVFDGAGGSLDIHADDREMSEEVARRSPGDRDGFHRMRRRISGIFDVFYPFTERHMMKLGAMLRMLPFLLRHRALVSVQRLVDGYIDDPFLRRALAFHPLLIGGDPATTPALYTLISEFERRWGVHYAIGGTGALVDALVALLGRLGGRVLCDTDVERIVVRDGHAVGVETANGDAHGADVVVSNVDAVYTHEHLVGATRRDAMVTRTYRRRPSMSLHVLYFGADKSWPESPLAHHNMLLAGNGRRVMDRVFRRRGRRSMDAAPGGLRAEDLFLYVHLPTRTDPGMAPPGCDALYVLVAAPPISDSSAESGDEAGQVRQAVLDVLDEHYLPGLSAHLVAEHAIGPEHFRDVLNTPHGAAFSLRPTLFQSGWFRPHNRSRAVDGLYLVGAGTHPGAGVPAVLASAKIAADLIAQSATSRTDVSAAAT